MQDRRLKYSISLVAAVAVSLATGACSMDKPSWSAGKEQRVELRHGKEATRLPTASANEAALADVVAHYRSSGDGPVELTVTYDPKSKTNTAMKAADEAARIATYLRRKGTSTDISSDILPVANSGDLSESIITYNSITAHAPQGCTSMGGLDGTPTGADEGYKYGCTIETQLSRQIASPKDLKGREGLSTDETDGRRLSNILEGYRTGTQNEPLQGESASE